MIEVIKAGALTTVQDLGRMGYRHLYGINHLIVDASLSTEQQIKLTYYAITLKLADAKVLAPLSVPSSKTKPSFAVRTT